MVPDHILNLIQCYLTFASLSLDKVNSLPPPFSEVKVLLSISEIKILNILPPPSHGGGGGSTGWDSKVFL